MAKARGVATPGPLRYIGAGRFLMGVPARDLTADEAALHHDLIAACLAETGVQLYEPMTESGAPTDAPAVETEVNNA